MPPLIPFPPFRVFLADLPPAPPTTQITQIPVAIPAKSFFSASARLRELKNGCNKRAREAEKKCSRMQRIYEKNAAQMLLAAGGLRRSWGGRGDRHQSHTPRPRVCDRGPRERTPTPAAPPTPSIAITPTASVAAAAPTSEAKGKVKGILCVGQQLQNNDFDLVHISKPILVLEMLLNLLRMEKNTIL